MNLLFPITNNSIKNLNTMNLSDNEDITLINENQGVIDEKISKSLLIYALTWNIHGKFPELEDIKKYLPKKPKKIVEKFETSKFLIVNILFLHYHLKYYSTYLKVPLVHPIGASFFKSSKEDWENALKIYFGDDYINLVNSNLKSFHNIMSLFKFSSCS